LHHPQLSGLAAKQKPFAGGFPMPQSRYQLLSVSEAAEQLGRKRWFVYRLLEKRLLPHYLIGGRRVISQRDLDAYVERNRVAAVGEKKRKVTLAIVEPVTAEAAE
jgi:excisionase family DNA binding protein